MNHPTRRAPPIVLVPGLDGTGLLFYRQVPLLARDHAVSTTRLRDNAAHMDELVATLYRECEREGRRQRLMEGR